MQSILMAQLQKANPLPLVLSGMGGVGKTQLAIAYATRYCGQFSSIFWLNATSNTTLQASFRAIADLIFENPNPAVLEGNQSVTHVNRWLSDRKNSRWLLIFDNYDETEDYKIKSHFPTASQGSIIITTRRLDRVEGIPLDLQPVAQTDGLEILRARSKSSHGSLGTVHLLWSWWSCKANGAAHRHLCQTASEAARRPAPATCYSRSFLTSRQMDL